MAEINTQINTQNQNYKQPGVGAILGGVFAGSAVQGLVMSPHKLLAPKIMGKMAEISKNLTADEFNSVESAAKVTLATSGLAEKGISVVKATQENSDEISKIIITELDNNIILKHLPKQAKDLIGKVYNQIFKDGKNACYAPNANKIIMPEKELNLAFFHEAGHAANKNLSLIGKILQKSRKITILTLPIAMIALWKTKKAPNKKPESATDKTTTFIKENAGKLTFAAFLPILLEEGLASIKGNNFAKKVLNPDLVRKVAKTNALGFSTYLGLASLSSLGIYLGTKVKDAIAKPKLVEH